MTNRNEVMFNRLNDMLGLSATTDGHNTDIYWKVNKTPDGLNINQAIIHMDWTNAVCPDVKKSLHIQVPTSNNGRLVAEVTSSVTKSNEMLQFESETAMLKMLLVLEEKLIPCMGVSEEDFLDSLLSTESTEIRSVLSTVLIESHGSSKLVRVRSRRCEQFGSANSICKECCSSVPGAPTLVTPTLTSPKSKKSNRLKGWCMDCSVHVGPESEFEAHLSEFHGYRKELAADSPVLCIRCGGLLVGSCGAYTDHLVEVHSLDRDDFAHSCGKCFSLFLLDAHLQAHLETRHNVRIHTVSTEMVQAHNGRYHCPDCALNVGTTGDKFRSHLVAEHKWDLNRGEAGSLKCGRCDKVLQSCEAYINHLQTDHLVHMLAFKYTCGDCSQPFLLQSHMVQHRRRLHGPLREKCDSLRRDCPVCMRAFIRPGALVQHMRRDHKKEDREAIEAEYMAWREAQPNRPMASCPQCDKALRRSDLEKHMSLVHTVEKVTCLLCGKTLRPVSMQKHLRLHEDLQHGLRFRCGMCEKAFRTKELLNKHGDMVHRDVKAAQCDQCGKAFKAKAQLKAHMRSFHGREDLIEEHNKKEEEDALHECTLCMKTFRLRPSLTAHLREAHDLKSKPDNAKKAKNHCTICQKGFSDENKFWKHVKMHVRQKLPCPLCKKAFVHAKTMKAHLLEAHNLECDDSINITQ